MFLPTLLHLLVSGNSSNRNDPEKGSARDEENHSADEDAGSDPCERRGGPGDSNGNVNPEVGHEDARQSQRENEDSDEEELGDAGQESPIQRLGTAGRESLTGSFSTDSSENASKGTWYQRLKHSLAFDSFKNNAKDTKPNYRYTPILSGVVIPFSILLGIPGLTEHWYVRTDANTIVENRANSMLLNAAVALSLTCAIIANICLVVRFLEREVKLMTFLCIGLLTIHGMFISDSVWIWFSSSHIRYHHHYHTDGVWYRASN